MNHWFWSDTHWFHRNIIAFGDRPFKNLEEMHETMIENHNRLVKDNDVVHHIGDVAFQVSEKARGICEIHRRLKGQKHLNMGNHDDIKFRHPPSFNLFDFYSKISLWTLWKEHEFFTCHVPLPLSEFRDCGFQVHGHLHQKVVLKNGDFDTYYQEYYQEKLDPRYINVCVEHTGYRPLHLDELLQIMKDRT